MDFHRLVATLNEIGSRPVDQKTSNSKFVTESPGGGAGPAQTTAPQTGPTMNLTLNARTMDDIESMMRLIQKVNPDVPQTPLTGAPLTAEPSIADVDADFEIDGLDADDSPMMGMTDLDIIDTDGDDGDNDDIDITDPDEDDFAGMSDREADDALFPDDEIDNELNDIEAKEDGGFQSATTEPNEKYKSIDYMNNRLAGGMNGPKKTFPKVAGGDNPMQRITATDEAFKESIRNDLRRRLEEAKMSTSSLGRKNHKK